MPTLALKRQADAHTGLKKAEHRQLQLLYDSRVWDNRARYLRTTVRKDEKVIEEMSVQGNISL